MGNTLTEQHEADDFIHLEPKERVGQIKSVLNSERLNNEWSVEVQSGEKFNVLGEKTPHYVWIRHSKTPSPGLSMTTMTLIYDTGMIDNKNGIKLHLNVAADRILEVTRALADYQDALVPQDFDFEGTQLTPTFEFKVATGYGAYIKGSNETDYPPRIVIYLQNKLGDSEELKKVSVKIHEIKKLLDEKVPGWHDTDYRARISERGMELQHLSEPDGSIVVSVGSTINASE